MVNNLIVMTVTHSGGSVLGAMLMELFGYKGEDSSTFNTYAIYKDVLDTNNHVRDFIIRECASRPSPWAMQDIALGKGKPWMLRDDRFCLTLDYWKWDQKPTLIYMTRDLHRIEQSFKARDQKTLVSGQHVYGWACHTPAMLQSKAQQQYDKWDGPKITFDYDNLNRAVALYSTGRGAANHPKAGTDGYR